MTAANPTAINNIDDLLRILEQNPELTAQLRRHTADPQMQELTRLVADLGQMVQANAAAIGRLNDAQEKADARLDAFIAEQRALNAAAASALVAVASILLPRQPRQLAPTEYPNHPVAPQQTVSIRKPDSKPPLLTTTRQRPCPRRAAAFPRRRTSAPQLQPDHHPAGLSIPPAK